MRIAKNIEMFELEREKGSLHIILAWDENDVVLIDTGLSGQMEMLREAVKAAGFSLEHITKVILTHQDLDHIGNAKALGGLGAKILAHELEAPYIEGAVTPVRIAEMESRLNGMGEDERARYERMKQDAPHFYTKVDLRLKDGEIIGACGGIQVIHTPGHMPGHIALLFKQDNILIAGDAAHITGGLLTGADPNFTKDMAEADISFYKIKDFTPKLIVCYHEGVFNNA